MAKTLEQIIAESQGQSTPSQPSTGFSPFPGMQVKGMSVGGKYGRVNLENPASFTPTETERERTPMAQGSVAFIDQFARKLGVDEAKGTVARQDLLAAPLVRELVPQKFQDYTMPEESSTLYNDLESAFQLGSIVLTGRQGDLQKLQQIRDVYAFGGGVKDKPKLIIHRLKNMRQLFQTFDRAGTLPAEQRQVVLDQASQQMDNLMAEADPNIAAFQKQFPGATIRRK